MEKITTGRYFFFYLFQMFLLLTPGVEGFREVYRAFKYLLGQGWTACCDYAPLQVLADRSRLDVAPCCYLEAASACHLSVQETYLFKIRMPQWHKTKPKNILKIVNK